MLVTCVPTVERDKMYGKERFHSMQFALDYKVDLFFYFFFCPVFK